MYTYTYIPGFNGDRNVYTHIHSWFQWRQKCIHTHTFLVSMETEMYTYTYIPGFNGERGDKKMGEGTAGSEQCVGTIHTVIGAVCWDHSYSHRSGVLGTFIQSSEWNIPTIIGTVCWEHSYNHRSGVLGTFIQSSERCVGNIHTIIGTVCWERSYNHRNGVLGTFIQSSERCVGNIHTIIGTVCWGHSYNHRNGVLGTFIQSSERCVGNIHTIMSKHSAKQNTDVPAENRHTSLTPQEPSTDSPWQVSLGIFIEPSVV